MIRKKILFNLMSGLIFFIANPLFSAPDTSLSIFSDALPEQWALFSGKGVEPLLSADPRPHISLTYKGAAPFGFMKMNCRLSEHALLLNVDQPEQYALVFYLNSGNDSFGVNCGGQQIQVRLDFFTANAEEYSSDYIKCREFIDHGAIDSDSTTWQKTEIPFHLFNPRKKELDSIKALWLQFANSDIPRAGISIADISLQRQTIKIKKQTIMDDESFCEFKEIPQRLLMPKNARISIEGPNLVVNGKPRFIIGTQVSAAPDQGVEGPPTIGYHEKYKWIYEKLPDYETCQRLGFDSMGFFVPGDWMLEFDQNVAWNRKPESFKRLFSFLQEIHLPLYVDFTLFPHVHGKLTEMPGFPPAAKMNPSYKQHWLPFNTDTEEGMSYLRRFWEYGARLMVDRGFTPFFYELFNEPSYFSTSPQNRQRFQLALKQNYQTI
ncbi:MAG TPA: hypothetical protein DC049_18805, partial [Spirochaetia bacterium]|nr:hypothetical protein [Spirochaetia bacterium]